LGFIFKNHVGFSNDRKAFKQKTDALKAAVEQQNKYLSEQSDKLKAMPPGSAETKRFEEQLAKQASEYQVQTGLQRKSLMEEEAKLYYQTYMDVQVAVESICAQHGIQLVLRYDREKIDPTNSEAIKRGILNSVIYQSRLDITDMVLRATNGVAKNPNPPPAVNQQPGRR
jgi:hypothetical protein